MKLNKADESYEAIHNRMETENGYYFGIHNVMFGQRIRAGRYGEMWVDLDWCCGSNNTLLMKTYLAIQRHLERWDGKGNPFAGLPSISEIKPLNHDRNFLEKVTRIIPEFREIEYIARS